MTCCQLSREDMYERYGKELRELRLVLGMCVYHGTAHANRKLTSFRPGASSVERLRLGERMAHVACAMAEFKTQHGHTLQWEAPSREVLKAVPTLSNMVGMWQQTDLIRSRRHFLHAGVGRPSSSMVRAPFFSASDDDRT